jgi:large subunit ribosomal protein L31e
MDETLERIYTIPLRDIKKSPANGRADRAVRTIRDYLTRHMKAEEVWIDAAVNQKIWAHGKFAIPSKIRVRARLFDDGVLEVSLPEEEAKAGASMREELADAREKKLEEAHKAELEETEKAMAEGAATPSGLTKPSKPKAETEDEDEDEEDTEPKAKAPAKKPATKKAGDKGENKPAKDDKRETKTDSKADETA